MKNFIHDNKILISIFVYLTIICLASFFVARPMIVRVKNKNTETQEKIAEQEYIREKLSKLPIIKEQFEMAKSQEDKISVPLTKEKVVELIERLEDLSDKTNNKIKIVVNEDLSKQVSQKPPVKKTDKESNASLKDNLPSDRYILMTLNLEGSYENFLEFLKKIENIEYYSDVISLKIIKSEGESNSEKSINPFVFDSSEEEKSIISEENKISSNMEVVFYLSN